MKKILFWCSLSLLLSIAVCGFAYDEIEIDENCGDLAFFDSRYISDIGDTYKNCNVAEKENIIRFHRCEQRYNPERTDNSIYMEKINQNDCHIDLSAGKVFPYMLIHTKFKTDAVGANIRLFYLRQSENGVRCDQELLKITPSGKLTISDGTVLTNVENGTWYEIHAVLNFASHRAEIYLNGEKKCDAALNSAIARLDLVRIWLDTGAAGNLTLDDLQLIGMQKPFRMGEENFSSVFPNDAPIENYLSDKTAFHAFGKSVFVGGEKTYPDCNMEYDHGADEIYADKKTLYAAYGLHLTQSGNSLRSDNIVMTAGSDAVTVNGKKVSLGQKVKRDGDDILVPLTAFSKKVLGLYTFTDGEGLLITAKTPISLDMSEHKKEYQINGVVDPKLNIVKELNHYMEFPRPAAAEIRKKYETDGERGHPRVLATEGDFERIRSERNTDSYTRDMCNYLIAKANGVINKQPFAYQLLDKQRLTSVPSELHQRIILLGFAWQMTGDKKYVNSAWKNLKAVAEFPDWNPSHMIDIGEINYAFAIGYDWLYDGFSEEQRSTIYRAAKEKGLDETRKCYYGRVPRWTQYANRTDAFVKWKSNFNTVINGGVLAGAAAFIERDPDYCFDIMEKSVRSLEYTMIGFGPEGAWIEGINYWCYTMSYLSKGVGALISATGSDFGLMSAAGLKETGVFFSSMNSEIGVNNFHDTWQGRHESPTLLWLARVYDEPALQTVRRSFIEKHGGRTVYDVLWNRSDWTEEDGSLPLSVSTRGLESVSVRSGYDAEDMYFSAHAGVVMCYHSHADVGSFVYDALGVRWAADLGAEDYNIWRDAVIADGDNGFYKPYRRRAEAHNVVVIDPNTNSSDGGQISDAFVPLTRFEETGTITEAAYDMTPAYADKLRDYTRTFRVDRLHQTLEITDTMTFLSTGQLNWFMTTPAEVEWLISGYFLLKKDGKTLYGKATLTGADLQTETTACEPLLGAPACKGQSSNPGYRRLRLYNKACSGTVTLRVLLSPTKEGLNPPPIAVTGWSYQAAGDGFDVTVDFQCSVYNTPVTLIAAYKDENGILLKAQPQKQTLYQSMTETGTAELRAFSKTFHIDAPPDRSERLDIMILSGKDQIMPLCEKLWIPLYGKEAMGKGNENGRNKKTVYKKSD